jgi:nitrate/nitrite transporter NarK
MSFSVLGISLSTLFFGFSKNIVFAIFFRFLSGLLGAGIFVPGVKLVSNWFNSEERGTALGLLSIGGNSGMIVASWIVPLISISLNWRSSLILMGLFGLFSAFMILILIKEKKAEINININQYQLPLKNPNFWYLSLVHFIRLGTYYTFIAWMPLVLREEYGLSIIATSSAMSLLNFAGIISNPIGGILADHFGEKKVLTISFFSTMLFLLVFTLGLGTPILYLLVFLLGWFINISRSPSFSIIPDIFGAEFSGSISGILNTFASIGALILPFVLGYIRDMNDSYNVGWYAVAGLALIGSIIMYLVNYSDS